MGQKANENEINFNYPIPRDLHMDVKMLSLKTRISVKDIVICALREYVNTHLNNEPINAGDFDEEL